MILLSFLKNILLASMNMLNGASSWIVFSFIIAGLLHDTISPARFHKSLGNTKLSSILKVTISGMFLPICSCGTIPLGLSMYYSGAYLGPVLAFMTSTPIINPIAVVLSYGLLGKELTIIYIAVGFFLPFVIGIIANTFGGKELKKEGIEAEILNTSLIEEENTTILDKLKSGMSWVINDLAIVVSKYIIMGMLFGGFILTAFPSSFIEKYLGNPGMLSLWNIAILATVMYVCAVGHIPFIAALIASGASPGSAITFLMAGAATNFPELISIYNVIGKRAAIMYASIVSIASLLVGYFTNKLLMPGFKPVINIDTVDNSIQYANKLMFIAPQPLKYICSLIIVWFFIKSIIPKAKDLLAEFTN
ncbi:efflux transporter SaoE [Tissierella praeacuta]|uniref:efflux transporter SaoE n=1 Tax=Tissierella praeacuta TaxID=43131 RepID=UPI0035137DB1